GAAHHGGHPVTLQTGLQVGVDHEYSGARLLGVIEVLGGDGLVVGGVAAHKNNQVASDPIAVGTGGGGTADGGIQRRGARGMADAGAGVHVVGAEKTRYFLVGVVGLVGQPARGDVPGYAVRVHAAQLFGDRGDSFVPGYPAEPFFAAAADH